MTKCDAFDKLWIRYEYCMMGYPYDALYRSMEKKEILRRLSEEEIDEFLHRRI